MPSESGSKHHSPRTAGPSPASPRPFNYMSDDEIATSDVTLSGSSKTSSKRRRIGRFTPPKSVLVYREPPTSPTIDRRRGKRAIKVPSKNLTAVRKKTLIKETFNKETSNKETLTNKSRPQQFFDKTAQPWEYDIFDAMNGPSTPPRAGFGISHNLRSPTLSQKSPGTPSDPGLSSERSGHPSTCISHNEPSA
ncbi:hypothetical protein CkaCkLH20_12838 [Colletotrichum karsti]|uniref:Uncharacterized protein n=1 Tax=Colletotrichum karsti TaxID=1095194 RepID=A0A9P6HVK5_9PEZI|nr:uncharacterized protein CkaCkLH20_12838 [Colletotrichum karsti]KAF9869651.1 hypothetical protein CkaCkLH20_12838 [Colletotrichum karsti]